MEPHDVKNKHENLPGYHPGGKNISANKNAMRRKSQFPGNQPAIMKRWDTNFQKLVQRTPYRIYFNILFQNVKHKCTNLFTG